jgi:hypothetical protein
MSGKMNMLSPKEKKMFLKEGTNILNRNIEEITWLEKEE